MPDFLFTSPEGQKYKVTGPAGATPEQAFQILQAQIGGASPEAQPGGGGRPEPLPNLLQRGGQALAMEREAGRMPDPGSLTRGAPADPSRDVMGIQGAPTRDKGTIFNERQELERNIKARGGNPAQDPQWRALTQEMAQATSNEQRGAVALGGGAPVGRGVAGAVKGGIGLGRRLLGAGEEVAPKGPGYIEKLRKSSSEQALGEATKEQAAVTRELVPQLPPELQAMRAVADKNAERMAQTQDLRRIGFGPDEAKRMVAQAERRVQETEQAVAQLDQQALAMPQVTAEDFGTRLRAVTKGLYDKFNAARENQAGFGKALQAGDEEGIRVPVKPALAQIKAELEKTVNPGTRYVLEQAKNALELQGGESLTLRAADSGRKWLQQAIQTKRVADRAIDKEASHALQKVAGDLIEAATKASPQYKEALTRYRILSRPLDVVERKGALRKVLDKDPMTTDYLLSEAKVVGEVVKRAQAGQPVFNRLLEESPQLKDAARLYFTHDLFGKEAVPSAPVMRNWLARNERPLRQLGLYDEFRDLRLARETAQNAVTGAKEGKAVASKIEARTLAADAFKRFQEKVDIALPKDIPKLAKEWVEEMRTAGQLTPRQSQQRMLEIDRLGERLKRRDFLIKWAKGLGVAALGYAVYEEIAPKGWGGYHIARRVVGD